MICIILVAGHNVILEEEIKADAELGHLSGVPKALLPGVGGRRILDYWWETIKTRQLFKNVYIVTNADKYKHYERWATASDFPVENIINDGTTTQDNRLGALADISLTCRIKEIDDDVTVVAGDMLFQDTKFDMAQVLAYYKQKGEGDLAMYYEMEAEEPTKSRGILEVTDNRIHRFIEKPSAGETSSRLASVVFYCWRKQTLSLLNEYINSMQGIEYSHCGCFMEWLINDKKETVYGMKLPTGFQLIGQSNLTEYKQWLQYFSEQRGKTAPKQPITKRAYARVGLMGNPSDQFFGRTIALSIANFWAEVTLVESEKLVLQPHPLNDPTSFGSLADLHGISRKEGYFGGLRLLQAVCKKFYQYCSEKGIALAKRNFTLRYDTNIPRQVGLAGSSAIVTATLMCLMEFFDLTDQDMCKGFQPQFILNVEIEELNIQAGLQDRCIQVYEGLVYMDFDKKLIQERGYGIYENLPTKDLPQFFVAYDSDPSDSGKIHSDVSQRWRNGDKTVLEAMEQFAKYAADARSLILNGNWREFANMMNTNFDLRHKIYGDACLGKANLRMIEIARAHGAAAKFPGSGGAIVGLCLDTENMTDLRHAYQREGFVVCDVIVHEGGNNHNPPLPVS